MDKPYNIPALPLAEDILTVTILKSLNRASRALAELKGVSKSIPNEQVLISTLIGREAQDSSAIENIFTTQDEFFRAEVDREGMINHATKEVKQYAQALRMGFDRVREDEVIKLNDILVVQAIVKQDRSGIRPGPGVTIRNGATGRIIYTPPQNKRDIERLLDNLLEFINVNELSDLDPLIKMAIIHHQFESIHPFTDGNGRTGRILGILYLVQQQLLDLPILYLSQYIIRYKSDYYRLLQKVRDEGAWEEWIIYMLDGIAWTAHASISIINEIKEAMRSVKRELRQNHPKVYSQDLLNNMFRHPYTKVHLVAEDLKVHPNTARKHLAILAEAGILRELKIGRSLYFINVRLLDILTKE